MQERLSESFITECAANGQEALNILRQGNTDIVVSDVMMPIMNGFELCEAIKKDIDLCHIPVIFLTAKNDIDSKVHGLQVGAEAYIEKPFSFEYLKNQIISLLSNREKEREAFSKRPFFPVKNMQMSKEDEEFMNKVIQTINDNIADESFNVERMAETLCMSRSSLLRKIKPLFNMPPLDFIRLIRLKKAAELIQEGKYTVGEISYMVGFSSHSYFSKLFCRQFGIMPKDFERQVNEERQKSREYRGGIDIEEMMKKKQ
jgi:YesN/AraC family two-component response regulator